MKKYLGIFFSLVFLLLTFSSQAFAYTLGGNQTASLGSTGFFAFLSGTSGAQSGKVYKVTFNLGNGTAQFGSVSNSKFDSLVFNALLSSASIIEVVNGAEVPATGSLDGSLSLGYNNISFSQSANQAAVVGGVGTGAGLILNATGTINGATVNFISNLSPTFMDFALGGSNGLFDGPILAFGSNNALNFSLDVNGTTSEAHGWVNGVTSVFFGGSPSNFNFSGDLHTVLSASNPVPEPTTLGLLFAGLLGAMRTRRKA